MLSLNALREFPSTRYRGLGRAGQGAGEEVQGPF